MTQPIALHGITPREAMADAIYRVTSGFDLNDWSLCESGFIKDHAAVSIDMIGIATMTGLDKFKAAVFDHIGPGCDTTHTISNIRIDERGSEGGVEKAYLTCYAVANHFRVGDGPKGDAPRLLAGAMYFVDMEREVAEKDGLWRVRNWKMQVIWREGDSSVLGMGGPH